MSITKRLSLLILAATTVFVASNVDSWARDSRDGLGLRAGFSRGPDQFLIGGQAEFGPIVESAFLIPSLDIGFEESNTFTANFDLRWYLLRVPETGLHFYGSAGPTIVLSPATEAGLSLTAGLHIPMKHQRRYNVEVRFGFGDIPDLKIVTALMFGL